MQGRPQRTTGCGLANALIKRGGSGATTLIHMAITAVWLAGQAPAQWVNVCMHAVYKGRGSRTSMEAYRGVTVLNIGAKAYVMLLLRRLAWTWRSSCMMHNTASAVAGASHTSFSTSAGWSEPTLLPCTWPLWTSARL